MLMAALRSTCNRRPLASILIIIVESCHYVWAKNQELKQSFVKPTYEMVLQDEGRGGGL
jgi:hypothetical protein